MPKSASAFASASCASHRSRAGRARSCTTCSSTASAARKTRAKARDRSALAGPREAVLLEAPHERAARHAEERGGLRLVAAGFLEGVHDALSLERIELALQAGRI